MDITKKEIKSGEYMKRYIKYAVILGVLGILSICLGKGEVKATEGGGSEISAKVLYLTFDDGPTEYTNDLLDLLARYKMKATFFMLEAEMKRNPEVVKRMVSEGHAVGVHGVSHEKSIFYRGVFGPLKEMEQANQTLESITGEKTYLARTPYGSSPHLTNQQSQALISRHYIVWDWNVDSRDWSYRCPEKTFSHTTKMIKTTQKEPKVILFHDMKSVLKTMELLLRWMEENQYTSEAITPNLEPVKLWRKSNR